jgi:hypothetical protein
MIHPAWSIFIAAAFLFAAIAWFRFKVDRPELQVFAYLIGRLPAVISLAGVVAGWLQRRERNRFFADRVDLDRMRALSWQEFELRVADVYRNHSFVVRETGGGGADGSVDLRLQRNRGETTLVQCKNWRVYKVGVRPARELFRVMTADGADRAMLVSSGRGPGCKAAPPEPSSSTTPRLGAGTVPRSRSSLPWLCLLRARRSGGLHHIGP